MITMNRGDLKAYLFTMLDSLDYESYTGFCQIALTAFGVLDLDGNLTEEYEKSPFLKLEGEILMPNIEGIASGIREQGKYIPCKKCGKQPSMFSVKNIDNGATNYQIKCQCGRVTAFFDTKAKAEEIWSYANE